ncbi:MAG: tetratricopeptide repeat protein [Desulfovibrio sp.]|uniref:O-linked N-acetylglucosamine transferase family protein n=1 Tax=Desulfovibrio sp. TaxID=885 RepID=UPI0025C23B92|nr:tetratricopeptide repeat protein [Desulfovibrio sp.]MCI7568406.1 tetratricopeptide repeat protein [Desulfovibrio sp.]
MDEKRLSKWFSDAQKLHQQGKLDAARKEYERILQKEPNFGLARVALAIVLLMQGRPQEAVTEARRGMKDQQHPSAGQWINYGNILQAAGCLDDACTAYEEAARLQPGKELIKVNLATCYMKQGRQDDAERLCRELMDREYAEPLLLLAKILLRRGERQESRALLERAMSLAPQNADIVATRAALALMEKEFTVASRLTLDALELNGNSMQAWTCLQELDVTDLPMDRLKNILRYLTDSGTRMPGVLSLAVYFCRHNLIWDFLVPLEQMLARSLSKPLRHPLSSSNSFSLLGCRVPQTAHRHAAEAIWRSREQHCAPLPARPLPPLSEAGPLRVGFLSSDLRNHATTYLIAGLLEKIGHERIHWYLYSASFSDESSARKRIFATVAHFINVASLSNEELARRIRADRIDVLIELNGMTKDTRASVLALRPAPIQITWLGMPGTLGAPLDEVQYILGDPWVTPLTLAEGFSEKILQLPRSYQPNDHVPPDLSSAGTRASHGLPEHAPVFCCFNQYYKFSPETFDLWARILKDVPDAVLWLLRPRASDIATRLEALLAERGIDTSRIIFAPFVPQVLHIARISHADLVLDTLPYNAHTTCSDALRAGVPVVTLPGETFAGRVAASILSCAGLPEWIAADGDNYARKAVDFARRPFEERQHYKARLREKYHASPMMDNDTFARYLEQLCLGLYKRHAAGLPPEHLRLTPEGELVPLTHDADAVAVFDAARKQAEAMSPAEPRSHEREKPADSLEAIALPAGHLPLLLVAGAATDKDKAPYDLLCRDGRARALLLEPDEEVCNQLRKKNLAGQTLLRVGVHDGGKRTLHSCRSPELSSFLEPDGEFLSRFPGFTEWSEVVRRQEMQTVRLDDVAQTSPFSCLKLGLQGGELTVLQHAARALRRAVVIQLRLAPTPLYRGGASLFETGAWLARNGWTLHAFAALNQRRLKPCGEDAAPDVRGSRCLQTEAVFIPDLRRWNGLDALQLGELAFWAHELLSATDLAERALWTLDQRDQGNRLERYRALPMERALMDARGSAPRVLPG